MPEFLTEENDAGVRLDVFLARQVPGSSRSYLQKMIRDGRVKVAGVAVTQPRFALKADQEIALEMPEIRPPEAPEAEAFEFPILFEDEFMLVINKPPGVVVHPGAGNYTGTIVNALLGRYPHWQTLWEPGNVRPGIVHRLDKDTSGCLVIAKTPQAQFKLAAGFAERRTEKTYKAIAHGVPRKKTDTLHSLIGRHPVNRQKMAIVPRNGKEAISIYRQLKSGLVDNVPLTLFEVDILTGRTHQIRVHLSSIGHPVLGDEVYGGAKGVPVARQMLHAWRLRIPHPESGEQMEFIAPEPADMTALIDRFEPLKAIRR